MIDSRLSVMMPAYNEAPTVKVMLTHVLARPEVCEVIAVDDGSTDGTADVLERVACQDRRLRVFRHATNRGKGAALQTAIQHLQGPYALVQDADLEYDPRDFPLLLEPLVTGRADAVNGVRGFSGHTAYSFWFVKGNQWLTLAANVVFNCYLRDLLSGYKAMRTDLWRRLNLTSTGFEVETEIVAKVVRLGYRFHEVPITYITRSRGEGKKLRARDGVRIVATLARIRATPLAMLVPRHDLGYHMTRRRELAQSHPLMVEIPEAPADKP